MLSGDLMTSALVLAASFVVILAGSELFTNGVEWLGEKLTFSEAAVGSLLAAVGTALPETFIPLVALLMARGKSDPHNAVGVGAIIGAPLMLSTVALFVMGGAGLAYRQRRRSVALHVSAEDARRDVRFFLPTFALVLGAGLAGLSQALRAGLAAALVAHYGYHGYRLTRITRHPETAVEHGLYLESLFGGRRLSPRVGLVLVQVAIGVVAILAGAREFVGAVVSISAHTHVNPGVLSLILSPLATELPEKYNSVIWIRRGKDHLALANITGAMAFQSCIPVALGLAYTPWNLGPANLLAGAVALASAGLLYVNLRDGVLGTPTLMAGGVAYGIFLIGLAILGAF